MRSQARGTGSSSMSMRLPRMPTTDWTPTSCYASRWRASKHACPCRVDRHAPWCSDSAHAIVLGMTDTALDELGPVDYLVVEFPAGASNFTGEMAKELVALADAGTIRVMDVLIL